MIIPGLLLDYVESLSITSTLGEPAEIEFVLKPDAPETVGAALMELAESEGLLCQLKS